MTERENLMRRIQVCDFALNDAALYLDTHPGDETALDFYKQHLDMRGQLADVYVRQFGPVSRGDFDGGPRWSWVDNPWPWQNEEA